MPVSCLAPNRELLVVRAAVGAGVGLFIYLFISAHFNLQEGSVYLFIYFLHTFNLHYSAHRIVTFSQFVSFQFKN